MHRTFNLWRLHWVRCLPGSRIRTNRGSAHLKIRCGNMWLPWQSPSTQLCRHTPSSTTRHLFRAPQKPGCVIQVLLSQYNIGMYTIIAWAQVPTTFTYDSDRGPQETAQILRFGILALPMTQEPSQLGTAHFRSQETQKIIYP